MTTKPRFTLTLEASPDPLGRDPVLRLRAALKLLLRAFGLRCTSIVETPTEPSEGPR